MSFFVLSDVCVQLLYIQMLRVAIYFDIVTLFIAVTVLSLFISAFTALVGRQEVHLACKNCMMRCWRGYLSGARCRLFAYDPADATAIPEPHHLLPHLNPDWFYLSSIGLPRLS